MAKTILLVEDEAQVRTLLERVLVKTGYSVISASNGREAIATLAARRDNIDLIITDLVMPEMSGTALARELCSQRPDLKVLFMTGYAQEDIEELPDRSALIQKPFTPAQLLERIRQML